MSIPSLLVVSILLHLYIGTRIVPSLSGAAGATLFTLLLMALATLAPTGLLARRLAKPPLGDTLAWAGLPFLGLLGCGCTSAVAPATGVRPSVSAPRRRSPSCGWSLPSRGPCNPLPSLAPDPFD